MAVNIPKLIEIRDNIINDLKASLGIFSSIFGKNFLFIFSGVLAAKIKLLYLTIADVQKNLAPDLADSELNGGTLERWGRLKLGRNPFPARDGIFSCIINGDIGAVIPSGTTFKSDDSSSAPGYLFVVDSDYTIAAQPDLIEVRSLESGTDSSLIIGDTLSATSPILNVSTVITVDSEVQTPLDSEPIEDYRAKVVEAEQLEPQGGAASDFRLWSYGAQGVKKSYPYAKSGKSAEVNVFVEATVSDSTDGKGTPSQTILDDVASVIEFDPDTTKPLNERGRRPLGAFVVDVLPITPFDVSVTLSGLTDTSALIVTTVEDALRSYINTVRPFVAGADAYENRNDILSVTKLSYVVVSALPNNVLFNTLSFSVGGVTTNTYQFLNGNIPYFDSLTVA